MDDNQLDRLFQQELQDYEASSQGAEANWERLWGRMAARRRVAGWFWLVGLLLLSGALALALTMTDGTKEAGPLTENLASPLFPHGQGPASSSQAFPPNHSAIAPSSAVEAEKNTSAQNPRADLAEKQAIALLSESTRPALTRGKTASTLATEVISSVQPSLVHLPMVASQRPLTAIDSVSDLGAIGIAVLLPPQIQPQPSSTGQRRWRWLPRIGVSLGWQQSQPTARLIQPWPVGVRAVLVEKGPFAWEIGLLRDRYRMGTDFRSQRLLSSSELEADPALVIPPGWAYAPPPDTQLSRRLRIDAPGLLLPLGLRFSPKLSSRWQPFVQAGMLLRYQFEPSIVSEYRYVVREDSIRASPVSSPESAPSVLVSFPDKDAYRGWQLSGWQATAGVRLRLHPHVSAQLEGYYQRRRAFDLPEQPSFQAIGIRATFWWER